MKLSKRIVVGLVSMIAMVIGFQGYTVADDDDPNVKAIEARQSHMQLYSFYAGHLFAMAKGKMEYDADLAKAMAENLNAVGNLKNGAMWPQGTDNEAYPGKTRALPENWTNYPAAAEKGKQFKAAAAKMAEVSGNGLDALRGSIGDLGQSCKGCHDDFRAEDF